MNVYGLCQICEKRIEVVNLKAHIRTCMESNARLKVAHGINHNSSNRNSNRSKEQGNAANCAKNILSIGDNLYHSSRKREASLDPQNSKKKFQSVQYLSTIERTEKAGSIGNQAYTNAICNETVGQQRRPSGHSKTSLQTIPWSSYLSMSGFLESDTTHSMTNARTQETLQPATTIQLHLERITSNQMKQNSMLTLPHLNLRPVILLQQVVHQPTE